MLTPSGFFVPPFAPDSLSVGGGGFRTLHAIYKEELVKRLTYFTTILGLMALLVLAPAATAQTNNSDQATL
jgi:hypothetical protein